MKAEAMSLDIYEGLKEIYLKIARIFNGYKRAIDERPRFDLHQKYLVFDLK